MRRDLQPTLTSTGVIPFDWDIKPISELASVSTGGTPNRGIQSYWDGTVPWVTTSEVDFGTIQSTHESITNAGLKYSAARLLRPGTLLMAMYGQGKTRGKVAVLGIQAATNQACAAISWFGSIYSPYAFFNLAWRYEEIRTLSNIGNQENLNLNIIKGILIPLPPLPEQRAIAEALSDVDAQIAALDALIAKKRDVKQAAMQQLLTGKTRLPGFTGEWVTKPIGEEIDLLTGFPFPSNSYTSAGIKLLRGSNVKRGQTDWSDDVTQYWPAMTQNISRYELQDGDLVIAMDGSLVGRSFARLTKRDLPALLLQRVARIRSKKLDVSYLSQIVGSYNFVDYCDSVKTVTAIPHISSEDIRRFAMPIPPTMEEQRAVAHIFLDMDAEIAALELKQYKTRAIKQGMMQELLTGKTRLI